MNSKEIWFSILMANHNNSRYIEDAIKSVLSQTYPKWELIIVDSGSTDNSIEKINLFLNDKRIKLIQLKKNVSVGFAKKIAADNASNEIFGILDADDKLHETALEVMAEAYQKYPECGFIYSTMWVCDSLLKNCKINLRTGPIIPEKTSIFKHSISHFESFRKTAYEKTTGFDPTLKCAEDKDLFYKLEEITRLKFINMPLYYYRCHEEGISQGKNLFQSRVYYYIARCKAYQRRLNTNLPNLSLKFLYREYYKITFHKIINFALFLFKLFKISIIIVKILDKFFKIPMKIKEKLLSLSKKSQQKKECNN